MTGEASISFQSLNLSASQPLLAFVTALGKVNLDINILAALAILLSLSHRSQVSPTRLADRLEVDICLS